MLDSVTSLPFNRHVGIQKSTTGEGLVELPSGEQFLNHIGTVHAGAQLALAEACSGEFLLKLLSSAIGVVPVVRRVEAKFKKPAQGRITAKINASLTQVDEPLAELEKKGRCLLAIHVDVYDEHGQHSLAASFEWFVAKAAGNVL
jgi:acyl-coenzyme A thioesterase PaaI-like protein